MLKKRIDLALLFTWRSVAKLKNSVHTNLLIFDEVFDGSLDINGTEEFMKILNTITVDTNTFIISWDMTGLEAVVDVTQDLILGDRWEKDKIFDIIKDPDNVPPNEYAKKMGSIIHMMRMRAMANTQRHYEIYFIHTAPSIDKDDLERLFTDNPQAAADLIRQRGEKLYSDRIGKATQVIV